MKEIEDNPKKWKDTPCSWIGRTNFVKMSMLPRTTYTCNAIPIKILPAFFTQLGKAVLIFVLLSMSVECFSISLCSPQFLS